MRVEKDGPEIRLVLQPREVHLLERALERASFIDTPVSEQADIATFCARALDALRETAAPK
jgi:hypothetical protein